MKVWITKYALTSGIVEKEVETTHAESMVCATDNPLACYHKPFWHTSREEAVAHAEKLRQAKIKSVKKQLDKLEKMTF